MHGPGKYDDILTEAREKAGSTAAVLMCFNGFAGPGFSVQADLESLRILPQALRAMADDIEQDLKQQGAQWTQNSENP